MNLLKKIFNKNFHNTSPEKLADDLGPLKGYFTYKGFDHRSGLWLPESPRQNTLVNQSKTSLIRLISQQQSFWADHTDPSKYKIAYMRFGNDNSGDINSRLYYDITEASSRISRPYFDLTLTGDQNAYPGGKKIQFTADGTLEAIPKLSDSTSAISKVINKTDGIADGSIRTFSIRDHANYRPPSHKTLKVELLNSAGTVIETIDFSLANSNGIYTRTKSGIMPNAITSATGAVQQTLPTSNTSDRRVITTDNTTRTKLFFDYSSKVWKIMISEVESLPADSRYTQIRVSYNDGVYNIINSIIPKSGVNAGTGKDIITRYGGNDDYYSVLANVEYRDADAEFIDDYSASFSINMGRLDGNGNISVDDTSGDKINYTEAFLFTADNSLFSAIKLTPAMEKDPKISYYVTWTIIAPL